MAKSGVPHSHGLHSHDHNHDHDHEHEHEHDHKTGKHYDSDDEEIGLHEEHEHEHKNTNVNLRASFIHVLGDALQNVGVLIAGIIVFFSRIYPLLTPFAHIFLVLLLD